MCLGYRRTCAAYRFQYNVFSSHVILITCLQVAQAHVPVLDATTTANLPGRAQERMGELQGLEATNTAKQLEAAKLW